MNSMPSWYASVRLPLLFLQAAVGMQLFAYPLARRRHFLPRAAGGLIAALFVASSGYIAQDIAGSLKTILRLLPPFAALAAHPVGILLADLLCYGGVFVVLFFAFRPYTRRRNENFDNKLKAVFSFGIMLFCIGMARLTQDNPGRNQFAQLSESLYGILCGVFILILQFGVMEQARLSRDVDQMRRILQKQQNQYEAGKSSMELVNEKYHDLKALLRSFHGQLPAAQMQKLEHQVQQYDVYIHTGNAALDVLLTERRALCASRGELYNDDPRLGDARLCGTTASLCGVEAADFEQDPFKMERAIGCDLMLHAWMLSQSGLPILYSGDEIGQLNDYTYHDVPEKAADSRYIHRGDFRWDLAELRKDPDTRQGKQFAGLRRLEELRAAEPCFSAEARVCTLDTGSSHVLGICRRLEDRELVCLYNFSPEFLHLTIHRPGSFRELMYGTRYADLHDVEMYPYGFAWLLRE